MAEDFARLYYTSPTVSFVIIYSTYFVLVVRDCNSVKCRVLGCCVYMWVYSSPAAINYYIIIKESFRIYILYIWYKNAPAADEHNLLLSLSLSLSLSSPFLVFFFFGGRVVHVERDWFNATPQRVSHSIHIGCKRYLREFE